MVANIAVAVTAIPNLLAMLSLGGVFTRLMRDKLFDLYPSGEEFPMGGSKTVRKGKDLTIVAYGTMSFFSVEAADLLAEQRVSAEVIDLRSIKPLDWPTVEASLAKTGRLLRNSTSGPTSEASRADSANGRQLSCGRGQIQPPWLWSRTRPRRSR